MFCSKYTTIRDVEQRRRYKADFNADYKEYRDLHAMVERVSRRFAMLEKRLKQESPTTSGYKVSVPYISLKSYFLEHYLLI